MTLDELRAILGREEPVNRVIAAGLRVAAASVAEAGTARDLGLPSLDEAAAGFEAAFAEYRTVMTRTIAAVIQAHAEATAANAEADVNRYLPDARAKFRAFAQQPELLKVGELNAAVRALREQLHLNAIAMQNRLARAEADAAAQRERDAAVRELLRVLDANAATHVLLSSECDAIAAVRALFPEVK